MKQALKNQKLAAHKALCSIVEVLQSCQHRRRRDYSGNDLETKLKHQGKIRIWFSLKPSNFFSFPPFFPDQPHLKKRVMECGVYERRV
ncbi:hypothetical protein CEXT_162501 [Caerostris extrusa]|uniref:Uncharacterized protein n=1 Tax=Caerostris extrusa TaxID=172846 RepID=A0AAV4M7N7_CAEEX|nr:hypothetical protein CEXT_162501 [Caerostris extrusa]